MGKKLDALLGRSFKASKLKPLLSLSISRLTVLKNHRQARCSLTRSDVVQLLQLGHHHHHCALLRVEQLIKEQNMIDVFVMIEGYCHLLEERIKLIEQDKECPEELKEAVSGLLYAATRCGEFPELQEMRAVFTSRFGKEFAARAIELRNNCGVNPKIIQKLSTRQPSLENRLKVLKEIASENDIVLQIEEASSVATEDQLDIEQKQKQNENQPESSAILGSLSFGDNSNSLPLEIENMEGLSDSIKARRKYKDVADAAEEAFKSAAYAAAAARAAVELSRSESHDPDDQNSPGPEQRKATDKHAAMYSGVQTTEDHNLRRNEDQNFAFGFEKVHPIQNYQSESVSKKYGEKMTGESEEGKNAAEFKESKSALNSALGEYTMKETRIPLDVLGEARNDHVEDISEKDSELLALSRKKFPLRSHAEEGSRIQKANHLNTGNRPISVRTRRAQRH